MTPSFLLDVNVLSEPVAAQPDERYLEQVVLSMPVPTYDAEAAYWHTLERARLESLGRPPPATDGEQ